MPLTRKNLVEEIEKLLIERHPEAKVTAGDRGVTIAQDGKSWTIAVTASSSIIAATKIRRRK